MDLVVFENNKPYIIDEFREGRFDYIELASDVAETKFFQFLFSKQLVEKLAEHYPSPRKRHHVPMWMYISSQLSLRLHGKHSFHSYPWIIRAGGLVDALGPEVAQRQVDDDGNVTLECRGFNDRNLYLRQRPVIRTIFASWPVTHRPTNWNVGTMSMRRSCLGNWEPTTATGCSSPTARIYSCRTTRGTKDRNGCCSTNTTIRSAKSRKKR